MSQNCSKIINLFSAAIFVTIGLATVKVSQEAKIINRYNHVPRPTHDTTLESDKNTNTCKHRTQESQKVIPFPAGDHKAAMNRQESMINKKHK